MTTTTAPPLHGLVHGMSDAEYQARPELSSTGVRRILDCPARYRWEQEHPPTSVAFDVGRAFHAKVLGVGSPVVPIPDEHLTPSGAVSTRAATREWLDEQRAAGLVPLAPDAAEVVDRMVEAVLAHPAARARLEADGHPEVSAFADVGGVACRARIDYLTDAEMVDLKTTSGTASATGFGRDAARHGYPIQEAHYADVLEAVRGERPAMAFVVVEKRPPHLVAVHYLDEVTRVVARDLAKRARDTYAECLATDTWPGYGDDPLTTQMPGWWLYQADDEEIEVTA
jgi:hypothetical protein